ncbi:MAG TPA: potassium transporter Kup [Gammaproteobacteria bacterium]|nr:potassium transporter Kup [Gammaproteobacteria bacterium]
MSDPRGEEESDPRSDAAKRESEQSGTGGDAEPGAERRIRPAVLLAVLGVVYGDIGTSPIYALRECFTGDHAIVTTPANIYGIVSIIFWSLVLIASLKYVIFVLRADNHGEGGIFALLALIGPWRNLGRGRRRMLVLLGLAGAAVLFGDIMITPAISILSAIEGVTVADPGFQPYVVPLTIVILVLLFALQSRGTARIGAIFGPIMLTWFALIGALGLVSVIQEPRIFKALNPAYAAEFFVRNQLAGYLVLSAAFLAVTGSEALYADLGHFGRTPIRRAWFAFILPALLLNYFGQGALLLRGEPATQPFFDLAPPWFLYPLVAIASAATIIASQAAITGAFSLTSQAVQLGQVPRVEVRQTSAETRGQIYVPIVNWILLAAAVFLVLAFRSSGNLSDVYGVAVNSTMAVTTVLAFNVAIERGGWNTAGAIAGLIGFLAIDLAFLGANSTKVLTGGWFSLGVGSLFFLIMWSWRRGSMLLHAELEDETRPMDDLLKKIDEEKPVRVPGTAVFVTGYLEEAPPVLRHHLLRTKTLHEQVILLTVLIEAVPKVDRGERVEVTAYDDKGIWRLVLHYGFMQGANIPSELQTLALPGLKIDLDDTTYYLGRQNLLPPKRTGGFNWRRLMLWRDRLYAFMKRNAVDESVYYHIPSDSVVEIGLQVRI